MQTQPLEDTEQLARKLRHTMKIKKQTHKVHPPQSWIPARITDIVEVDSQFTDGKRLAFVLKDAEGDETWAYCNPVLSEKSTLGKFVRGILSEIPDELDTHNLIGRDVVFMVEHYHNPEGEQRQRVTHIVTPKQTPAPTAGEVPPLPEDVF